MAELRALNSIVSSLRGVDKSTSSFKQAANDNQRNMSKIVKDLTNMSIGQKRQISNLTGSLDEISTSNQQNAARINTTNSLLEDSLKTQRSMVSELKSLRTLFEIQLKKSSSETQGIADSNSPIAKSALSSLAGGAFKNMAMGAFKIGAAGSILGASAGQISENQAAVSGNRETSSRGGGSNKSVSELVRLSKSVGFSEEQSVKMAAIAAAESGGNPNIDTVKSGLDPQMRKEYSIGLWQINWKAHKNGILKRLGITDPEQLRDPEINAKAAKAVYDAQGYRAWSVFSNGKYMQFMGTAQKAVGTTSSQSIQQSSQSQQTGGNLRSASEAQGNQPQPSQTQDATAVSTSPATAGSTSRSTDTENAQQEKPDAGAIPQGDIVSLGKYLQSQGIRVSEHPAFGGVGRHAPNSAHYSGRAIDLNIGHGIKESADPVHGKRFDELAKKLEAAGYKVIWRKPGHEGHMHVQVGGGNSAMYGAPRGESMQGQRGQQVGNSYGAMSQPMNIMQSLMGGTMGMQQMPGMMNSPMGMGMGANPISSILGAFGGGRFGGSSMASGIFGILQNILPPLLNSFQQPERPDQRASLEQPSEKKAQPTKFGPMPPKRPPEYKLSEETSRTEVEPSATANTSSQSSLQQMSYLQNQSDPIDSASKLLEQIAYNYGLGGKIPGVFV
jgi:hypothetical protein